MALVREAEEEGHVGDFCAARQERPCPFHAEAKDVRMEWKADTTPELPEQHEAVRPDRVGQFLERRWSGHAGRKELSRPIDGTPLHPQSEIGS
jgi:hypothetical protein